MIDKILDLFSPVNQEICRSCPGNCCSGATAILLTRKDLLVLSQNLGKPPEAFASKRRHLESGRYMWQMIPSKDGTCSFLNTEKLCGIYDFRPIDCRLYPLDLIYKNGKFYWVVYAFGGCKLSEIGSFENSVVRIAEKTIIPYFEEEELFWYATDEPAAPSEEYRVIREVNIGQL